MGDLVYRQGPQGYVPSGEPRGASADERMASMRTAMRGMLPGSQEWIAALIQMLRIQRPTPPGIPGVNGAMPARPTQQPNSGMLPLPGGVRG